MPPIIVVIDDDPGNNQLVQTLLSGYQVIACAMAEEGLNVIRQQQPKLILIDLRMPGMSGLEAIRIIKSDPKTASIPIIVITATMVGHALQEAIDAGINDWLTKPFNPSELKAIVEKHVAL